MPVPSTDKDALDEDGRLYLCKICRFNLDSQQEGSSFGGPDDRAANYSVVATPCPDPTWPIPGDPRSAVLVNVIMGQKGALRELDAAGDEKPLSFCRKMQVGGCPLCGTRANEE